MKLFPGMTLVMLALFSSTVWGADEPVKESMVSLQGFTGLLNTPSAHVNREGSIHLLYSDQRENIWRDDQHKRQENYLMSLGLFSFFELGGRLTEVPKSDGSLGIRDLSASFKATSAPFTKDRPYWPVLAVGIQDVGGGANQLRSRYIVVSEDFWRFRLSAGYGFSSERMKGGFGGVEFQAHDWITLLGEHDTKDTSAGIRIVTPEIWKTPVQLTATLKSTLNHNPGTFDFAAGLTFPLDFRKKAAKPSDKNVQEPLITVLDDTDSVRNPAKSSTIQPPETPKLPAANIVFKNQPLIAPSIANSESTNTVSAEASRNLGVLQKNLVNAGFTNVRVGQRASRELIIEYENTIFNHNELDALGIVAGITSEVALESFETLRIVIKRNDVRVAVISVPLKTIRKYMKQATNDSFALKESLDFSYGSSIIDDSYFYPQDNSFVFPNTTLILAPGLQTFVGTEAGVFDYVLSFRPEILSNLWKGGVFQARWDIPLVWSGNFDDGKVFQGSRNDARMDRAMLYQGINLAPGVMLNLGAGLVLHNIYGTVNEITWSPGEGAHRFRGVQAWARNSLSKQTMDTYLGSYRFFYAPLDVSIEATAGKFWGQDRGFSLELKRFFADTAVSTYYKNTTTQEGKHWQAAGVQFVFPLTPRKDLKVGPVTVRGTDEWSYAQETTLAIGGQKTNDVLTQALAINPQPSPALYRSYFNRDRLSADYLNQHLDRLRESWNAYRPLYFEK